jgi:hypothetical protein
MTDLALALIGGTDGAFAAGGASAAPKSRSSANNNPAVLNKPMRRASRRDRGKLRLRPSKLELAFVFI